MALIAGNVLVYLASDVLGTALRSSLGLDPKRAMMLSLAKPHLALFFSYQFVHGDIWHLLGNMLFLWVFGNSVNSKMGHLPYILFYLAGGVFAGAAFAIVSDGNLMGASGAIAAVTTAYLVLFPRSEVTVFYWLWFYVGTMHVGALLLIGVKTILWDNIVSPHLAAGGEFSSVAYSAHIAGYLFGFVVCGLMLLVRAVPQDHYDIVALARRYYRRQRARALMADPNTRARAILGRVARPVSEVTGEPIELPEVRPNDEVSRLRGEIAELVARNDYGAAADRYQTLVAEDPDQCLPRRQMLLVANQLMVMQRFAPAAAAYERLLKAYPTDSDVPQVRLLLGIVYAKYLQRGEAAASHLRAALSRLTDQQQMEQARQWLETLESTAG
jgi:membrane associated rhomboid family serine protease